MKPQRFASLSGRTFRNVAFRTTGVACVTSLETVDDDIANRAVAFILDGDNLVPYLTGQIQKSPRESFLYINDDQQLTGLPHDN